MMMMMNDDNDVTKSYDENIMDSLATCMLNPYPILPINVHPDDLISDLKLHIQYRYGEGWGLGSGGGQRVDRDGLFLGWELLVHYNSNSGDEDSDADDDNNGYRSGNDKGYGKSLSYHSFLSSYGIKEGDLVHAIVRRRDV